MAARIQCDMTRHGRYAQSVQLVLSAADKIKNMYRYALRSGLEHSLSESLYQNLESLDLRGSAMGDLGVSGLASGLRKVRCLAFLDISSNAIGPNGAANLGRALGGCRTLRHLDLGENRLDPQSAQVMASALLTCPLQYLDMRSNNIGVEGARSIAQALQQSRTITHLNFARNWACAAGAESLATALSHSESLTYIDLSSNSLYENGVLALALLSTCPNLKHLNLAMNFFGDEGAGSLSRWIRKCKALEHLDLSSNGFLSTGAASLAEALAYCTALSHLDVSGNRCQNEGAKCLMSELSSLPQLASMDFGRTGMHWGWGAELETILSSLARCSALAHLQLHGNNFSSGGTEQLAQGLRKCKRLRTLGMSNCALEDVGGAAIAELLGNGGSLESVDIQNNDIGADLKHQMLKCHDAARAVFNSHPRSSVLAFTIPSPPARLPVFRATVDINH
eukprot:669998-Rhodomonas_salina.4